jgi:FecR protein
MNPPESMIERYHAGVLTPDEEQQLLILLKADPALLRQFTDSVIFEQQIRAAVRVATPAALAGPRPPGARLAWWRRRPFLTTAAACLTLALTGLWMQQKRPAWATVIDSARGVEVIRDGVGRPAQPGDVLENGDSIQVSENSSARLKVTGFGMASLGPEAVLASRPEGRMLELQRGFMEIEAVPQPPDKPWRIRTPQAEVAVIGTRFSLASADGRTALRVQEGMVNLLNRTTGEVQPVPGGKRAFASAESPSPITGSRAGSVLLLTSRSAPTKEWDDFNRVIGSKLMNSRLWRLGFRVQTLHYDEVQPQDLRDRALVILSVFDQGVGEPGLERIRLADSPVPVLCLEPDGFPVLGMTLGEAGVDYGTAARATAVEILAPAHPLAAGPQPITADWFSGTSGWGKPAAGAQVIACLIGRPDQAVCFAYESSQLMAAPAAVLPRLAPARRLGLFLDPHVMSDQAHAVWQIFEAAVDWSVTEIPRI